MSEKIQPTHLERDAYVYVRRSSMTQVRNHLWKARTVSTGLRSAPELSASSPCKSLTKTSDAQELAR